MSVHNSMGFRASVRPRGPALGRSWPPLAGTLQSVLPGPRVFPDFLHPPCPSLLFPVDRHRRQALSTGTVPRRCPYVGLPSAPGLVTLTCDAPSRYGVALPQLLAECSLSLIFSPRNSRSLTSSEVVFVQKSLILKLIKYNDVSLYHLCSGRFCIQKSFSTSDSGSCSLAGAPAPLSAATAGMRLPATQPAAEPAAEPTAGLWPDSGQRGEKILPNFFLIRGS